MNSDVLKYISSKQCNVCINGFVRFFNDAHELVYEGDNKVIMDGRAFLLQMILPKISNFDDYNLLQKVGREPYGISARHPGVIDSTVNHMGLQANAVLTTDLNKLPSRLASSYTRTAHLCAFSIGNGGAPYSNPFARKNPVYNRRGCQDSAANASGNSHGLYNRVPIGIRKLNSADNRSYIFNADSIVGSHTYFKSIVENSSVTYPADIANSTDRYDSVIASVTLNIDASDIPTRFNDFSNTLRDSSINEVGLFLGDYYYENGMKFFFRPPMMFSHITFPTEELGDTKGLSVEYYLYI